MRDNRLNKYILLHYLQIGNTLKNPMYQSNDTHKSICDIFISMISSTKVWVNAINKQKDFMENTREYYNSYLTGCQEEITHVTHMSQFTHYRNEMNRALSYIGGTIRQLDIIRQFLHYNEEYLTIDGPDRPFNIFHIKLPAYIDGLTQWVSLQEALMDHIFTERDRPIPNVMGPIDDPIRLVKKMFGQKIIRTMETKYSHMSLIHVLRIITDRIKFNTSEVGDVYLKLRVPYARYQYSCMGKARYTFAVVLHWVNLIHQYLFTDQIAHMFVYNLYQNIKFAPVEASNVTRIWANLRTLTCENMPDDPDDPILYTPFEPGQIVYKMRCCGKDISEEAIKGILRSGRTPCCPMCRGKMIEFDDTTCPPDPTVDVTSETVGDMDYVPHPIIRQRFLN